MMTNFASVGDRDKFRQILKEFVKVIGFTLLLLAGVAFLTNLHLPRKQEYTCDMETVVLWKQANYFKNGSRYFSAGHLQSKEKAHSGNFSVKTGKGNIYALVHDYPNLTGYEEVTVTVWRSSTKGKKGAIVMSVPNNILWKSGAKVIEKTADGWEKIQLMYSLPMAAKNKTLTMYLWNSSKEIVYFDDLEVKIVQKETL